MSAVPQPSRLTLEDFLAWEAGQEGKHEFVDGEVFAMSGGSKVHHRIALNIYRALYDQLAARGCFPFHEAQILAGDNVFYPDVTVACGADAIDGHLIEHPRHLFEVLSSSTADYDRGKKRMRYQERLASLQTYVLVAQHEMMVEVLRRTRHGWTSELYSQPEDVIELFDPPCRLTLANIYEQLLDRPGGELPR
ncbi:MAG: Uma2 family endonuclease [Myxococcales bacterium]|nr:Uma2 family endonuclease [Myxococcales bacterium]